MTCRMKGCDEPAATAGFCVRHHEQLEADPMFAPVRLVERDGETITLCGLCGRQVYRLERIDEEQRRHVFALDAEPMKDGRCVIMSGGFKVLSVGLTNDAAIDGVPLYQTHPAICPKRKLRYV